jgi:hypothetical protein
MGATDRTGAFTVWSRAAFRATLFVVAIVLLSHRTYGLRDQLKSSGTGFGVAVFGAILTTTLLTTRRQLRRSTATDAEDRMGETVVAGAFNGLFVLVALMALAMGRVMLTPPPGPGRAVLALPFVILFGAPFAFTIGAVVAVPVALIEEVMGDFVDRLCRWVEEA